MYAGTHTSLLPVLAECIVSDHRLAMTTLIHFYYPVKVYCVCTRILQMCHREKKKNEIAKKRRERQFHFFALPFYLSSFSEWCYHGDIDSPAEYYGFHKILQMRGHRDKPGQFQAGILDSYFIGGSYFITGHTIFTLVIQTAVGLICLNHQLVFCGLFVAFACCW